MKFSKITIRENLDPKKFSAIYGIPRSYQRGMGIKLQQCQTRVYMFVSLEAVEALQGYSNHHECIGNLRGRGGGGWFRGNIP